MTTFEDALTDPTVFKGWRPIDGFPSMDGNFLRRFPASQWSDLWQFPGMTWDRVLNRPLWIVVCVGQNTGTGTHAQCRVSRRGGVRAVQWAWCSKWLASFWVWHCWPVPARLFELEVASLSTLTSSCAEEATEISFWAQRSPCRTQRIKWLRIDF